MPAKNVVKEYIAGGHYHIYNRGVEKRVIFLDEQDCSVFLHYLKLYLSPVEELQKLIDRNILSLRTRRFLRLNLEKEVDLIAFALMPNHFHLLIKQNSRDGITKFMQRLMTGYVMYFNKKYKRVGALFQNIYKACYVPSDDYLLHLSRYIHLNPFSLQQKEKYISFSSYPYYLGKFSASWVKPHSVLAYFQSARKSELRSISSYQSFVEEYVEEGSIVGLESMLFEEDF